MCGVFWFSPAREHAYKKEWAHDLRRLPTFPNPRALPTTTTTPSKPFRLRSLPPEKALPDLDAIGTVGPANT